MSIDNSDNFNFKNYIVNRFFRIAPLFYVLTFFCYFIASHFRLERFATTDKLNLLYHLTFFNGFVTDFQNSIIGIE